MRSWSIPAGRLFGVDIRIHLTFVFLLAFVWFTQSVTMGAAGAMRGLALVGIIFGCVVLHELGHAVVANHNGVAVRSIILLPIGGVTLMEDVGRIVTATRSLIGHRCQRAIPSGGGHATRHGVQSRTTRSVVSN